MSKVSRFCAGLAAVSLLAASAGALGAASPNTGPAPEPEGQLTIGWSTLGNESLNPVTVSAALQDVYLDAMFDYLVRIQRDTDQFVVEPSLATEFTPNEDSSVWTFTLREGVVFHNGDPFTSADVKYTFEQYASEASTTPRAPFIRSAIGSVETPDEMTAVFNLTRPIEDFPMQISDLHSNVILPASYMESVGLEEFARAPIGTGPYRFVSQALGSGITMEAVADHWRGTPSYQMLEVRLLADPSARMNALQNGEVDAIDLPPDLATQVEDAGGRVIEVPNAVNEWINLANLVPEDDPRFDASVPWHDERVRQAMNMAVDREGLVQTVYSGHAQPAGAPLWLPGTLGMRTADDAPVTPFDPEGAEALLAEAGFEDGFSMDLYVFDLPPATQLPRMGEAVAQMWGDIGIEVNIIRETFAGFRDRITARELTNAAWVFRIAQFPDLTETVPLFWQTDGTFPIANSAELDAVVDELLSTPNLEEREAVMNELVTTTAEAQYAIPGVYSSQLTGISADIGDWPVFPGLGYKITYADVAPAAG